MELQSNKVIMMVDDDPDDFFIVREVLRENGFKNDFRLCADGEELMDYLYRRGRYADEEKNPMPGIILLDLNMPKVDGRQVLAEIKEHQELRHIPVIILTTSSDPLDIDICYRTGANSYIEKPQSFEMLSTVLTLAIKHWTRTTDLPAAEPGTNRPFWPGNVHFERYQES